MAFNGLQANDSIMAAGLVAGAVFGLYQSHVGPVSQVHMTPANDQNVGTSIRKAGFVSVAMVAGFAFVAKDMNILIFGGSAIIAQELVYRHAHMASPETGQIQIQAGDYAQAPSYSSASQATAYAG
jgi:hypothetical protein